MARPEPVRDDEGRGLPEGVNLWCAGLPLAERRPMTDADRRDVGNHRRWLRRRGLVLGVLSPISFSVMLAALLVLEPLLGTSFGGLAAGAVAVLVVVVSLQVAAARAWWRRSRDLAADLRAGVVLRFAGPLGEPSHGDPLQQRLLASGLLRLDPAAGQQIEALPISRRVWRVNGRRVTRWVRAGWSRVAEAPAFAGIASQWLEQVSSTSEGVVEAGRRELSTAEKFELTGYLRRRWTRPLPFAVATTVWLCLVLGARLSAPVPSGAWNSMVLCVLATVTVAWDALLAYGIWQARVLTRDLRYGYVLILRYSGTVEPEDTPEELRAATGNREFEMLAISRAVWTEGGRPAAWRKLDVD